MALPKILQLVTGTALSRRSWQDICQDLLRLKDEATVLRLATELLRRYQAFEPAEKLAFFQHLLTEFRVDPEALREAIDAYLAEPDPWNVQRINRASLPSRRNLFEILNMSPGGTPVLLQMRADLAVMTRNTPELRAVDSDLEILFRNWFNRGFLNLEKIDWTTPAFVLEKLIKYEAVHEISGWDDLRQRVSTGRRCYAFFHPALPSEPIIFVQVALVKSLVANVSEVLGEHAEVIAEDEANTAIFYSISNCQKGLVGIAFGDLLIKQVAEQISAELPQIKTFATLSPVPGFNKWLGSTDAEALMSEAETQLVGEVLQAPTTVLDLHADGQSLLTRLCAYYLLHSRRGDGPSDPVARFHLRNGARLERINWLGDSSERRLGESAGLLVNYVYDLDTVTRNHETYVYDHGVVASNAVSSLAKR